MTDGAETKQPTAVAARLALNGYRQAAAVLGAFSMAVFFGQLYNVRWRGILAHLVGLWSDYVRPVVRWLVDGAVAPLNHVFGLHIEVPLLVRDYLAAGAVLCLSMVRVPLSVPSDVRLQYSARARPTTVAIL